MRMYFEIGKCQIKWTFKLRSTHGECANIHFCVNKQTSIWSMQHVYHKYTLRTKLCNKQKWKHNSVNGLIAARNALFNLLTFRLSGKLFNKSNIKSKENVMNGMLSQRLCERFKHLKLRTKMPLFHMKNISRRKFPHLFGLCSKIFRNAFWICSEDIVSRVQTRVT